MKTTILFCGYSYHTQPFYSAYKSGYPSYLFRLQTEGTCKATVNGKEAILTKGDLLLVRPGDQYDLIVEEMPKNQSVMSGDYHVACEGAWLDDWWERCAESGITRIQVDETILSLWRHLIIEDRRPSALHYNELSDYFLRALCLSLDRAIKETSSSNSLPFPVAKMMRYIEEHATTPLKLEQVARHAGLSVSRAGHLFKESLGKTIIAYTLEIRLAAAVERMKYTTMTLEQIAEECGFGAYPYFHRVFQKKYGISPGAYRRME
ncbi:AraC family transcriptional regulator [Bacillus sp. FJAT-27225]|uniref:AraC family transcriptional regulator n=1 Tax=Bacillus sp. FJAT-27225 TaxID=1743144 RepID=UPI00080C2CE5|nr:AraC family transcriptional regulator [Bacillus sp. FJAT-27225]OCA88061.1 AraC family transcriptional regulator [Bacillus sp. FJAT-27225]